MKNTDWKIIIAAIVYTLLFYKQEAGINYLIFSIVIMVLTAIQKIENIKKPSWIAVSLGTLISGFFVFYYGTSLPIIANIISLIFLAGISFKANSSLLLSAFNSLTSLVFAIPLLIQNFIRKKPNKNQVKEKTSLFKKVILLLFPLFVVFIFFVLYRDSNPLFMKITEDINLEWLSFPLVKFFLFSLFFMYSFFVQNIIKRLNKYDQSKKDDIVFVDEEKHKESFFSKFLSLESEIFTGTALLVLLNLMIAFLNAIDINYLWLKNDLPQGLVFSDYLHSGTFTLIVSILFAILIILYFFRGIFNFSSKGKWIKLLGFLWVVQNIVMIISAMFRNQLYIADYGMTHKRIGVYIFLLLAIIGLVVSFIKIALKKNTLFIIRKNSWAFYAVLIIATFINWDMLITKHNIKLANKKYIIDLDKNYLARLSHVNTYALALQEKNETPTDIYFVNYTGMRYKTPFQEKLQNLLNYENRNNWQEFCLNKNKNIYKLKELNNMGKLAKLDLYAMYLEVITEYKTLSNIKAISLNNNLLKNSLAGLENYKQLEVVNLASNSISSLDSFPTLKNLTHLNLENNQIVNYSLLKNKTPNLKYLNISNSDVKIDDKEFPSLEKLESINLSKTKMNSWAFLTKQKMLKEIIFSASNVHEISLPEIPTLEKVDLSNSVLIFNNDTKFLNSLARSKYIKDINMNSCKISYVSFLLNKELNKALFPNLEILNLYNNNLQNDIKNIHLFTNLKELNLSLNNITIIDDLAKLKNIKSINLSNNSIRNFGPLAKIESLETLNLSQTKINNIEELIRISKLKNLDLSTNDIRNIDSIIRLQNLEILNLSENKIKDISALAKLPKLTHLSIANNLIEDFTVLKKMKNLKYLAIGSVDLKIVEELKIALPNTEIDYFSKNLNSKINYNNNKRADWVESF